MKAERELDALINHAQRCATFAAQGDSERKVRPYVDCFDAVASAAHGARLNIFVFHIAVPDTHRRIEYIDVKHDHWGFDYQALTQHFLWATLAFNERVHIFYVTSESAAAPTPHPNVSIVRIAADDRAPMYERVKAMVGYVHSAAFSADTVFLDTDAYPNRALAPIFKREFDVGVTYRTTRGYMPINEGVIFCSSRRGTVVRRFFDAYLNTYDVLACDPIVRDYYGNIGRWRGGQLSLNAIGLPPAQQPYGDFERRGIRVAMLPCNQFNYWVTKSIEPDPKSWDRKFVLHLKGDSKQLLGHVARYQRGRREPQQTPLREAALAR